jgi:hypothetical protein
MNCDLKKPLNFDTLEKFRNKRKLTKIKDN